MTAPSLIATLREIKDDPALYEEWISLVVRAGSSYFQTPAWVIPWWETIGGQPETRVGIWRSETRSLEALVPMYLSEQRLHRRVAWASFSVWELAGSGPGAADHCDPAAEPHRSADVEEWLVAISAEHAVLLRSLGSWDDANLPDDITQVATTRCPRLSISEFESGAAGSRKFHKQVRYYERRLQSEGVTFVWVPPEEMTHGIVDDLFRLHHERRSSEGLSTSLTPDRKEFHKRLVDRAGSEWGPCAVRALHSDRCIAVLYGFMWQTVFYYYQSGWSPAWHNLNLGTTLVARAIHLSGLRGARIFDFLRGAESYKYRFGARDALDRTLLLGTGLRAQLVKAKFRFQ